MMYPKLAMFKFGNKVYHPMPWPETLAINLQQGEFYQKLYRLLIIESQNKNTVETICEIRLQETSVVWRSGSWISDPSLY